MKTTIDKSKRNKIKLWGTHPYMWLRFNHWLSQVMLIISLWLLGMGIYHLVYVVINLSTFFAIVVERILIWGYLGGGVVWLGVLVWIFRAHRPFPQYIEETFDLSFKWYNALDQARRHYWEIPPAIARNILVKVHPWRRLWQQSAYIALGGYLLAILLLVGHASFPALTQDFRSNVQAIMLAHTYQHELTYPQRINQGADWEVGYKGDYDTAAFYLQTQKLFTLKATETERIEEVHTSFTLDLILVKGRVRKKLVLPITVTPPPTLETVAMRITHLPTGKVITTSGVKRILIDQPSRIHATLAYNGAVDLTAATIEVRALENEKALVRPLSYQLLPAAQPQLPQTLTFTSVVRQASQFLIVTTNAYQQTSTAHEVVFLVRANLPPTITIESPAPILTLFELQDIPIVLTVQDDIALRTLAVYVEARDRADNVFWETQLLYPNNRIRGRTFVNATLTLPLRTQHYPTGTRFIYWGQVEDYAGLSTTSSQQIIGYLAKSKFYEETEKQSETIGEALNLQDESIENLSKEYERLQLLSEKKTLEQKDIKRFEENTRELNERLREEQQQLEQLEKNLAAKENLSPALENKLAKLKQTLEELDEELLQKLAEDSRKLLETFASNVAPEELLAEIKRINIERLEQRIDETIKLLENFKSLQELNNLKELAQNLYERFRDLESYMVYEDLTSAEIAEESSEIAKELHYMKEKFTEIAPAIPQQGRLDALKKAIAEDLNASAIAKFNEVAKQRRNNPFINERTQYLDSLRKNLTALVQTTSDQELTAAIAELNYQIVTLGEKTRQILQILGSERYAAVSLREDFLRQVLSKISSSKKTIFKRFKDALENVAPSEVWESGIFETYAKAINQIELLQRTIDPAAQLTQNKKIESKKELARFATVNNQLARDLIVLKKNLSKERELQNLRNELADAANNQNALNQRTQNWLQQRNRQSQQGQPSDRELAYLQSLLAEQAAIRELLQRLAQGQQQGRQQGGSPSGENGKNGKGKGGKGGEGHSGGTNGENGEQGKAANGKNGATGKDNNGGDLGDGENLPANNSLARLTEQMRKLENELIQRNPDLARIRELQVLIENNLLKHSEGLKKEQDQEQRDDERRAEQDFDTYQPSHVGKTSENSLYLVKERLTQLKEQDLYPAEYRAKIAVFLKALRETFNPAEPSSP